MANRNFTNFTNFNEFLNIRYIRRIESIYMNPSDFDYMVERFKKISEENDKLKAEIERLIELMPKICETCKYEYELGYEEPCNSCENYKKWVLKGKVGE